MGMSKLKRILSKQDEDEELNAKTIIKRLDIVLKEPNHSENSFYKMIARRIGIFVEDKYYGRSIGQLVWPLRIAEEEGIPEEVYISSDFIEVAKTDFRYIPLDIRVIETFTLKVQRALDILFKIITTSNHRERVSKSTYFAIDFLFILENQKGLTELVERAFTHKNIKEDLLFFINHSLAEPKFWDNAIDEIVKMPPEYVERLEVVCSGEDALKMIKYQLANNLPVNVYTDDPDVYELGVGALESLRKGGPVNFTPTWGKVLDMAFDNPPLFRDILERVHGFPREYALKTIAKLIEYYGEGSLPWIYMKTWERYVFQMYLNEWDIWVQCMKGVRSKAEFYTLVPEVIKRMESPDGYKGWLHVCEFDPQLWTRPEIIPSLCVIGHAAIYDYLMAVKGDDISQHLDVLVPHCLSVKDVDNLLVLVQKVDIQKFEPYFDGLWNLAQENYNLLICIIPLVQDRPVPVVKWNNWQGILAPVKMVDSNFLKDHIPKLQANIERYFKHLGPAEYLKLRPFREALAPSLVQNVRMQTEPSALIKPLLFLWRWCSVNPSDLETESTVWEYTFKLLRSLNEPLDDNLDELFSKMLHAIYSIIKKNGMNSFRTNEEALLLMKGITRVFLKRYNKVFFGTSCILVELVKLGITIPHINTLVLRCTMPLEAIEFMKELATVDVQILAPYTQKLSGFVALCLTYSKGIYNKTPLEYSKQVRKTAVEVIDMLSVFNQYKTSEWNLLKNRVDDPDYIKIDAVPSPVVRPSVENPDKIPIVKWNFVNLGSEKGWRAEVEQVGFRRLQS